MEDTNTPLERVVMALASGSEPAKDDLDKLGAEAVDELRKEIAAMKKSGRVISLPV